MSAPTTIRKQVRADVSLNDSTGLRRKLGNLLRSFASCIDGRDSLAFEIRTQPPLTTGQHRECIGQAFKALTAAVAAECDEEALEDALRDAKPHLYESEKQGRAA